MREPEGVGLALKAHARVQGRKVRQGLSDEERAQLSRRIVERCQAGLAWGRYRRVHVFLPIERQREVDTWPLVRWLWGRYPQIEVLVPRMLDDRIEQVVITPQSTVAITALGIPEPVGGMVAPPETQVDVALVPLLAFDGHGTRVGYGGGWYDELLAQHPEAQKVGLAYEACRVAGRIAAEAHDVRLDAVVTEERILTCACRTGD